ncbi:hypothetical protein VTJ49DRAFT_1610 [Mycothermus thermophilus]|uniref:F-box domain-containing protein n=1 Tax=Humicola insolens TaxID=85995 RepID=A0ABR3VC46_HUMIN
MLTPSPAGGPAPALPGFTKRPPRALDELPTELLQRIAEALVPPRPATTRFILRDTGTWAFLNATVQWAKWRTDGRSLRHFALASRRFAAIAKPLLYHTLVAWEPSHFVALYLRLARCPEIRPWIRSLTFLINVGGSHVIADVNEELRRQTGGSWDPSQRRACHSGLVADPTVTLPMDLLRFILTSAVNLQDFLMAAPDEPSHYYATPDTVAPDLRHAILRCRTTEETPRICDPIVQYFPFQYMRNLTSLRIYCHREDWDRQLTLSRLMADFAVAMLPHLKQVKTLELCCASADDVLSDQPQQGPPGTGPLRELPPLPHIEHLRLYGSHIHEPRLVALCLACVNLQTLVVHFESSTTDEERPLLPDGKTLSDALEGLAGTLRTLELVSLSEGHYLTRGTERPRKPENHRLRCIPTLTRLEELTLDYRGVFGTLGILDEDDGERLCQLLPPSVRDFTLVCEWGTERDWKQSYLANLDMVLHGVECLCASPAHVGRLSSISLAIHSWPAESRFHRRFKREVESARQRCARAGIRFRTFDLFPAYQDEDEPPEAEEEEEEEGEEEEEDGPEERGVVGPGIEEGQAGPGAVQGPPGIGEAGILEEEDDEIELDTDDEASEYYFSGDEDVDPDREARRPPTFNDFLRALGEDHGHSLEELYDAYFHQDRWDEYLFD